MDDEMWTSLGEKVDPGWASARESAVRAGIARRSQRRRSVLRAAVAVGSAGALAAGALALVSGRLTGGPATPAAAHAPAVPTVPAATDRRATAAVTPLSPDTVLAPLPDRGGRGFALRAGGARFSVAHDARRPFVVLAGGVTIEDLGTTFTVRYVARDRLNIAVEEGQVRVRSAGGADREISAGAALDVALAPVVAAPQGQARGAGAKVAASWRPLAERGRYEEAQRALRTAGPGAVRDDTADLLLAADAARLSGHPADAVPYLQRVLGSHGRDPRAGLAAFTLGRVLLDELGRPGEAVAAFGFARSAGGPLAEDALAREVEALARAGDAARSRELALLYQRRYPNGRRAKAVSKFGGLD